MTLIFRFANRLSSGQRPVWMARIAAAGLAWIVLPYVWLQTLGRWLQYGLEAGLKWPAATLGLWLVLAALGYRFRREANSRPDERVDRAPDGSSWRRATLLVACWCLVQAALWRAWSSPLNASPGAGLLFVLSTLWLFWTWAIVAGTLHVPSPNLPCNATPRPRTAHGARLLLWFRFRRVRIFGGLLLVAGAAVSCLQANGLDGAGKPQISSRLFADTETTAIAAAILDRNEPFKIHVESNEPSFPCFRGADGLGVAAVADLRGDWSALPPRTVWRRPLGAGWSGFAIDAGQAFTQEQVSDSETVVCYDLATGREQWSHADRAHFESASAGDGPRATPAVAGDCVYSLGGAGLLNCLDRRTGRRRWSVDILADSDASNLMHALSGSPLVVDELVVVSAGGDRGKSLAAYDRATGRRAWRAGDDPAGYGSPLVCTLAGRRQIVILNRPGLAAHDVLTGCVLWTFPWSNSTETNCSQPIPVGENRLFVSSGYGKGCALLEIEARETGPWSVRTLWTSRSLKTKFASAVIHAGHAYGLDDGILCCVDLADGRRRWKAGRYGHGQVLLAGDKLVVQCESGEVALVAADPAGHRELGRFAALVGKTWNYPALAGRWLLCRNDREAACFELPVIEKASE